MKKVMMMAVLVGSSAHAGLIGTLKKMSPELAQHLNTKTTRKADLAGNCTDFSGKWKFQKCDQEGVTSEDFAIKQTKCTSIKMDDTYLSFGGLKTESESGLEGDFSGSVGTISWNASRNVMSMYALGYNTSAFSKNYGYHGNIKYYLDNSNLVQEFKIQLEDPDTLESSTVLNSRCYFEKQN